MTRAQFFRALTWTDWVWKVSKTKSQIFKTHAKINLDSANICHSWFYVKKDWPNCKLVTKILSYKTICYSVKDKVSYSLSMLAIFTHCNFYVFRDILYYCKIWNIIFITFDIDIDLLSHYLFCQCLTRYELGTPTCTIQ